MSSLGQTLRNAREAKGLTLSKVAAETRILVQIIEDIENEDFSRIPAPIYGRGFVRLFADCVGVDSQPLVREFMDIYTGKRTRTPPAPEVPPPPPIAPAPEAPLPPPPVAPTPEDPLLPPVAPAPEEPLPPPVAPAPEEPLLPPVAPAPEESVPAPMPDPILALDPLPPVETPLNVRGLDLFDPPPARVSPVADIPPAAPAVPPPPRQQSESPFLPPNFEEKGPGAADRFRSGLSSVSHGVIQTMRGIPRSAWRKSILALAVAAVVALIVFGCMKLYRMTTPPSEPLPPEEPVMQQQSQQQKPSSGTDAKKAPVKLRSTGQQIPSLYVD